MKKMTTVALLALLSTGALANETRDAILGASSNVSNSIIKQAESTVDVTVDVADFVADKLRAFISVNLASSVEASGKLGEAIVKISEVSKPVFKMTGEGIAMVFELSGTSVDKSLQASEKLVVLLDPTLEVTGDVLVEILKQLSKGSELSSEVSEKIIDLLDKPLELTNMTLYELFKLLEKGSKASSDVTNAIFGSDNVEKGLEVTGNGISLTSKGFSAVLYFISKGTSAVTEIFEVNREEIEKAVERDDQRTLEGLRQIIRADIQKTIDNGEVLNQLLTDADLDFYIEARLLMNK